MTPSLKRQQQLREVARHVLLPECLKGSHSKANLDDLFGTIAMRQYGRLASGVTLVFDVDDTVLCTDQSLYEGRTCMNLRILPLIETLCKNPRLLVNEILLLTARETSGYKECEEIALMKSEAYFKELEKKNPIHIALVAYYLNKKLEELGVSHQVSRVFYANARYPEAIVGRKADLLQRYEVQYEWNFIMVDNSQCELEALHKLLPHPQLLPPVAVHESTCLSEQDIQKVIQAVSPSVHHINPAVFSESNRFRGVVRRSQSLSDLRALTEHEVGFFEKMRPKNFKTAILFLGLTCLFRECYEKRPSSSMYDRVIKYVDTLKEQIEEMLFPSHVALCVFDMPDYREYELDATDWQVIRDTLKKEKILIVTADTLTEVIAHAKKYYPMASDHMLFVTASVEQYRNFESHFPMLLVECRPESYDEKQVQDLLAAQTAMDEYTLCVDIDDTTILVGKSFYQHKTCINSNLIGLIRHLDNKMTIKEIIFLTARPSSVAKKTFEQSELSEKALRNLHPIEVERVLYYFNASLNESSVSHQVTQVLYSKNDSKSKVKQALMLSGHQPILIDNNEEECDAWNALVTDESPLPAIKIYEDEDIALSDRNLKGIIGFFMEPIPIPVRAHQTDSVVSVLPHFSL